MKDIKKKLSNYFHEILKIKTSPHSIALGFAISSFVAILPTPGISIIIVLILILLIKNMSKLSSLIALAFWNPIFQIPLYLASWEIGNILFKNEKVVEIELTLMDQIFHYTKRYLIGNFIIAIFISVSSYFLIRIAVSKYQKKHSEHS